MGALLYHAATAEYLLLKRAPDIKDFRLAFIIGTTHFYRGEAKPENELVGVIYAAFVDERDKIQLSPEHSEYRWLTAVATQSFPNADDPGAAWIRRVIARAEAIKAQLPSELINFNQKNGFELG